MAHIYLENLEKIKDRGERQRASREQAETAIQDLTAFVHRIASHEYADSEELEAMVEIAALLLVGGSLRNPKSKEEITDDFERWKASRKQAREVMQDLVAFLHRVASNENATSAELEALPEVAGLVLIHGEQNN